MPDEIFDVCDADDRVIGQATRAHVHAENLLHRAVHIWLWNSRGELMVHVRSEHKDQYPGRMTSSASGHLDAGEDYAAAAARELREELGLSGDLAFHTKLPAAADTAYEHTVLYCLKTDETPSPDPHEIAEVRYYEVSELAQLVSDSPDQFTPPFRMLFEAWRAARGDLESND